MSKLTIATLSVLFYFLAPSAYAQGPYGPSGSGAQSAAKQAESTHPDALSGKAGTPRAQSGEEEPQGGAPQGPAPSASPPQSGEGERKADGREPGTPGAPAGEDQAEGQDGQPGQASGSK